MTLIEACLSWYHKSQTKIRKLFKGAESLRKNVAHGHGISEEADDVDQIPSVSPRQERSGENATFETNNFDASEAESLEQITSGTNKGIPHKILTTQEADRLCRDFTEEGLLLALNSSTSLNLTLEDTNVRKGIEILRGEYRHDFGTAYAWFKTASVLEKVSLGRNFRVHEKLRALPNLENYDESLTTRIRWSPGDYKSKCKINDMHERILNPECAEPRRLWDLYSNRVIPYDWHIREVVDADEHTSPLRQLQESYGAQLGDPTDVDDGDAKMARVVKPFVAISHSWTADMRPVVTTINRQQWPVPLPVEENGPEATLEHIRWELLNTKIPNPHDLYRDGLLMIYVWLDILCLRQSSHSKDILGANPYLALMWGRLDEARLKEWEIDVPTMGMVYTKAEYIVCYMNGIGRRFREDGWDDERHWVNRAWTMQEYVPKGDPKKDKVWGSKQVFLEPLIMGMPKGSTSFMKYKPFEIGYFARPPPPWEHPHPQDQLPNIAHQLARRYSSNPCDKIAVFAAAIRRDLPEPPIYSPGDNPEVAWSRLLDAMGHQTRRNTFFHLDTQTGGWAPTWFELMYPSYGSRGIELQAPATQTLEPIATTWRRRPYIASFSIKCTVKSEPRDGSVNDKYSQIITADMDKTLMHLQGGHGSFGPERPFHLQLRLYTERPVSPGEYFLIVADRYHLFEVLPNKGTGTPAVLCFPIALEGSTCSPSYRKMGIGLLEWCHDLDELKACKGRLYSAVGVKADLLDTISVKKLEEDFPNPSTRPYSILW